jgi:UDP-N-acetylmuramate-alanine ligase
VDAVKSQYPEQRLVACMELHTYSSLNAEFLTQYAGTMNSADVAMVYFNPHALDLKRLPQLSKEQVKKAFEITSLQVFDNSEEMKKCIIRSITSNEMNLLMMSSGDFNGMNMNTLGKEVVKLLK